MNGAQILATGAGRLLVVNDRHWQERIAPYQEEIESVWRHQCQIRGNLFNGRILNFIDLNPAEAGWVLRGHFVDYQVLLAKQFLPHLPVDLAPIAVSGLTCLQLHSAQPAHPVDAASRVEPIDRRWILVARRARWVTHYPGFYELVPSGGVDESRLNRQTGELDYLGKLKEEFAEESGFNLNLAVDPMHRRQFPYFDQCSELGVVFDPQINCYDLCATLEATGTTLPPLEKKPGHDGEYEDFSWIEVGATESFIAEHRQWIVPTSLALLDLYFQAWIRPNPGLVSGRLFE
ncbi:MAG: hypothetical protein HQL67_07050 [Magnetococcales bacterium]|nr:hypothetical protein [Magnetococcales bacterium]